jgi:hypothetical protein
MEMVGPPVEEPTASSFMSMVESEMFPNVVFTLPPFFLFFYCTATPANFVKTAKVYTFLVTNACPFLSFGNLPTRSWYCHSYRGQTYCISSSELDLVV